MVRGPFRIVRHPAYLGELIMILACGIAEPRLRTALPLLAALPFVVLRILVEECVMMNSSDYASYTRQVRWRLIPKVW